jgi:hypothetical protein
MLKTIAIVDPQDVFVGHGSCLHGDDQDLSMWLKHLDLEA